jgi:hypothetical protein
MRMPKGFGYSRSHLGLCVVVAPQTVFGDASRRQEPAVAFRAPAAASDVIRHRQPCHGTICFHWRGIFFGPPTGQPLRVHLGVSLQPYDLRGGALGLGRETGSKKEPFPRAGKSEFNSHQIGLCITLTFVAAVTNQLETFRGCFSANSENSPPRQASLWGLVVEMHQNSPTSSRPPSMIGNRHGWPATSRSNRRLVRRVQ